MTEVKPITVHDLRHTHTSVLIATGMDPVVVARRLGHESPGFTMQKYRTSSKNSSARPRHPWSN